MKRLSIDQHRRPGCKNKENTKREEEEENFSSLFFLPALILAAHCGFKQATGKDKDALK